MGYPLADHTSDQIRDDFLDLTSDLRTVLDRVQTDPGDTDSVAHVLAVGRSLGDIADRAGVPQLLRSTKLIERMAHIGRSHARVRPDTSVAIFADMQDAVGHLEQLFEGWLDGWDDSRQEYLYRTLRALFPDDVEPAPPPVQLRDAPPRSFGSVVRSSPTTDACPTIEAVAPSTSTAADASDFSDLVATDVDPELLEVFGVEAGEIITVCEELVVTLDDAPEDHKVLDALFRQFHTLAGAAAAVGLEAAAAYIHEGESLLEAAAAGHLAIQGRDLIDFLFRLVESVGGLVNRVRGIEDSEHQIIANLADEIAELRGTTVAKPGAVESAPATDELARLTLVDSDTDPELMEVFGIEAAEILTACEQLLLGLDRDPNDRELLNALFRQFHTLKGAAAAVGLEAAAAYVHEGESLLEAAAAGRLAVRGRPLVDFLFRLVDSVAGLVNHARGLTDEQHHIILNLEPEIAKLQSTPAPEATPLSPTDHAAAPESEPPTNVRVADRPNVIVREAEELAPEGNEVQEELRSLRRLQQKFGGGEAADELAQVIATLEQQTSPFSQLATELQGSVTTERLVPFDTIFRRLSRSVRDAARQESKHAELALHGGRVTAERTVVEALYGPLLHLVRNAVSHGIEAPAVRAAAGKPRTGTIRVSAEQMADGGAVVTVIDDGAGLDFDAILAKARAKQLIAPTVQPTRSELLDLIFHPGFTTRDAVTQLAGRGVGMDFVAREIQALNGRVEIDSQPGSGTTVRLRLPPPTLTLTARPPHKKTSRDANAQSDKLRQAGSV